MCRTFRLHILFIYSYIYSGNTHRSLDSVSSKPRKKKKKRHHCTRVWSERDSGEKIYIRRLYAMHGGGNMCIYIHITSIEHEKQQHIVLVMPGDTSFCVDYISTQRNNLIVRAQRAVISNIYILLSSAFDSRQGQAMAFVHHHYFSWQIGLLFLYFEIDNYYLTKKDIVDLAAPTAARCNHRSVHADIIGCIVG